MEKVKGILEVLPDGFGFLRGDNYLSTENDVYVSPSQIKSLRLRTGDVIEGDPKEKKETERYRGLMRVDLINGHTVDETFRRRSFEKLTPIFANKKFNLETPDGGLAMRIIDLLAPIGKGQRGLIVSPPKAGKTTLLKSVANSIIKRTRTVKMIILLIDERPEEVTDFKDFIKEHKAQERVDVIYSTFDELPEHHTRVAEMVLERAKRLVEHGEDVVVLLDSITRLARAYNLTSQTSGRTLSGGLDPASLHFPKKFFGAARNTREREGGSLTILATALVDTGSKMDDVIYEEFKGTGNMELVLNRNISERRIFPAIDILKSGTRRDDLLLSHNEQEAVTKIRKSINRLSTEDATESILNLFSTYKTNEVLVQQVLAMK
ncbi:transcription termination factor Rho [Faecalicoccus pleomorphus]|uniref:transcription termination factor Rho n=1 Tax=Faecalicoccus pleomorphus TaxID=1323 RepID=UPI001960223F|nr:transcription termination factor Rho [Faecalicoccus pleomorphus]MBM6808949.1 transcription termination factor Rho [Faecalicoccus pleomorphus]